MIRTSGTKRPTTIGVVFGWLGDDCADDVASDEEEAVCVRYEVKTTTEVPLAMRLVVTKAEVAKLWLEEVVVRAGLAALEAGPAEETLKARFRSSRVNSWVLLEQQPTSGLLASQQKLPLEHSSTASAPNAVPPEHEYCMP